MQSQFIAKYENSHLLTRKYKTCHNSSWKITVLAIFRSRRNVRSRGFGPFVPSIFFFLARPFFLFFSFWRESRTPKATQRQQKQTDAKQREALFLPRWYPPPHRRDFPIDLQQRWSINRKIGDRQCTYYLIVRALTIADCCFFCSRRC